MKKTICFYFQVHQPFRLRRYRFFDIGSNHQYFDDFNNRSILRKVAEQCYLPMNKLLLDLIHEYGKKFKIAFSISGTATEQFQLYAPEVLESFKELAKTGCVEFLAETSAHSLSILKDEREFERQVNYHCEQIKLHFGQKPTTFRLTELIYSDEIGAKVAALGFKTILTEGARHVMGWKSPNFIYTNAINPKLKVLLRNFRLSDDISFRFSDRGWAEWPVTSEKYVKWLNELQAKEEMINLFMDYETFGEHQAASTGIFEFMRHLPQQVFSSSNFEFLTPSEAADKHQPIAPIHVPFPISWADEERDLTAWLGNELQDDAFDSLYRLSEKMDNVTDPTLIKNWLRLQNSDHFYYMCTKWFSDGNVHKYFNPYATPYEAYINYMNVLSDFVLQVDRHLGRAGIEPIDKKERVAGKLLPSSADYVKQLTEKELGKKPDTTKAKKAVAAGTKEKAPTKKATASKTATVKKAAGKEKQSASKAKAPVKVEIAKEASLEEVE